MAARITFQGRDGELRLYDGASPPKYLSIPFVQMNFSTELARPRPPDPIVETVGGYVHLPDAGYGPAFYQPTPITFSCWIDDTTNSWKLRDALGNPDMDSTWRVGTQTWTTAKGQGGSIVHADGNFVATPTSFFDTKKNTVNAECLWTNAQAGSAWGIRCRDIYFPPQDQEIRESPDTVEMTLRGLGAGDIVYIGAFSTGTAS